MLDSKNDTRKGRIGARHIVQMVPALSVLVWRALTIPVGVAWRDWIIIASAYWLFSTIWRQAKVWPAITLLTMAFLLGIYFHGQFPHTFSILGFR